MGIAPFLVAHDFSHFIGFAKKKMIVIALVVVSSVVLLTVLCFGWREELKIEDKMAVYITLHVGNGLF